MNNLTRKQLKQFEKLDLLSIYLCGPIKDCTDDQVHAWRDEVTQALSPYPGITVRDPAKRDYRQRLLVTPFNDLEALDEEIITKDEEDITLSEALVFNCYTPSAGSSMEIYNAWHADKCVITIVYSIRNVSPWVRMHSTYMIEVMHDLNYMPKVLNILQGIFPRAFSSGTSGVLL